MLQRKGLGLSERASRLETRGALRNRPKTRNPKAPDGSYLRRVLWTSTTFLLNLTFWSLGWMATQRNYGGFNLTEDEDVEILEPLQSSVAFCSDAHLCVDKWPGRVMHVHSAMLP